MVSLPWRGRSPRWPESKQAVGCRRQRQDGTAVAADAGEAGHDANLAKVDHVVVLMLENRSFDHMLGYLSLTGKRPDVDGLRPEYANHHEGRSYPVHHLSATTLGIDPDHSAGAIDR